MIAWLNAFWLGANISIALHAYLDEVPHRTWLTWVAIGIGTVGMLADLLP